jgi:hypothetical protein
MTGGQHLKNAAQADPQQPLVCPFCDSPISSSVFEMIKKRLNTQVTNAEQTLRQHFATEQRKSEEKAAADLARVKANAVAEVEKARTKAFADKLALEQQLEDIKRRLQSKTAHDLGEPAEVDLHAALLSGFPNDCISRVAKGVKGADVLVEVMHQGNVAGCIILDSKNHRRWSNAFTKKLREDQIRAKAEFAILSSSAFPAGKQHIHVQDSVIVAHPARVPVLVELLRLVVVQTHLMKLKTNGRNDTAEAVFEFMTSNASLDLFDRIAKVIAEMDEIDKSETAQHEKTWSKRSDLNRLLRATYQEFASTIDTIVGANSDADF